MILREMLRPSLEKEQYQGELITHSAPGERRREIGIANRALVRKVRLAGPNVLIVRRLCGEESTAANGANNHVYKRRMR